MVNFFDAATGEGYWLSGCRKDEVDRLYGERAPIYIDEEVQEEYWKEIRSLPEMAGSTVINGKNVKSVDNMRFEIRLAIAASAPYHR